MSMIKQLNTPSLEISGNIMQVPPIRDPTKALVVPKKSIQVTEPKKRPIVNQIVKSAKSSSSLALTHAKPRITESVDNTVELNNLKDIIKKLEVGIVGLDFINLIVSKDTADRNFSSKMLLI